MLKHALKHGYEVTVCEINEVNRQKARDMGATLVNTPAEVGARASFVMLGVGYDDEVNQVVLGENGLMKTLAANSVIAVSFTVSPRTVQNLEKLGEAQKFSFLTR